MTKYLRVLEGLNSKSAREAQAQTERPELSVVRKIAKMSNGAVVPAVPQWSLPRGILEAESLRSVTERLAPLAAVGKSLRILIAGCNEGDGASSIAAALAFDLSERLSLRTLLFDGHLRRPILDRMFASLSPQPVAVLLDGSVQIRQTRWKRLYVGSYFNRPEEADAESVSLELSALSGRYDVAVVDIGVPRLDPRALALVRPNDPILLVVRYGQTERRHLAITSSALEGAGRSIAGVIFNARHEPINEKLRRLTRHD